MGLGEPRIKRALAWILERQVDEPAAKRSELIERASREFDLTPVEADFLYRHLSDLQKNGGGKE
jgi:hypothetical protein